MNFTYLSTKKVTISLTKRIKTKKEKNQKNEKKTFKSNVFGGNRDNRYL